MLRRLHAPSIGRPRSDKTARREAWPWPIRTSTVALSTSQSLPSTRNRCLCHHHHPAMCYHGNTCDMRPNRSRITAWLSLLLLFPASQAFSPSESAFSVVREEYKRLRDGVQPNELAQVNFASCLRRLIAATPTQARIGIVTSNALLEREAHIASGALGRIPSLFSSSTWVVIDPDVGYGLELSNVNVERCNGVPVVLARRNA